MAFFQQQLTRIIAIGGICILPAFVTQAQSVRARIRGPQQATTPAGQSVPTPAPAPAAAPAQPAAAQPPQSPAAAAPQPLSMLQQPAQAAQIAFADNRLSIHAENASLTAILHQVETESGMHITGLGNDERVFGTFGPGAPRDVLADLMNGTAYNLVLLGDLTNGAPRELILTPVTRGDTSSPSQPFHQAVPDEAVEQETSEVNPPPPDVPPPPSTPPNPGVRSPQQLFEQLQQMRQAQQQGIPQPQVTPPPQQQ